MKEQPVNAAKQRILEVSTQLFSQKGFDATSINNIAEAANVNKALLYYYFKNKESILDELVDSLFRDITALSLDFIYTSVVRMIKEGLLDILSGRFRFADKKAAEHFFREAHTFSAKQLDYLLEQRALVRIVLSESLKNGNHKNDLFRVLDLTRANMKNPIFKAIYEADNDFQYSDNYVFYDFFFTSVPLLSFVAYYDNYKEVSSLDDTALRKFFLDSIQEQYRSVFAGENLILRDQ